MNHRNLSAVYLVCSTADLTKP